MKKISILIPCYNEVENIHPVYDAVTAQMAALGAYEHEILFIDNASTDGTQDTLRALAQQDPRVKVIMNMRNFGHIRSVFHGFRQADGDAVIYMPADLQEPVAMIETFIREWEKGSPVVIGIKTRSRESTIMYFMRNVYYSILRRIAENEQIKQFTFFGIYDKMVLEAFRKLNDPHPYLRGLIFELGFPYITVEYTQERRQRGTTKFNFYALFGEAMLGFTNSSKLPLRLATFTGLCVGTVSLLIAAFTLIYKLLNWETYQMGMAALITGLFFFSSVQLFYLGILGEYIGGIWTQTKNRPLVVERERINFPSSP